MGDKKFVYSIGKSIPTFVLGAATDIWSESYDDVGLDDIISALYDYEQNGNFPDYQHPLVYGFITMYAAYKEVKDAYDEIFE